MPVMEAENKIIPIQLTVSAETRRRLYKKYRLSGLNMYQSARLAGYSEHYAKSICQSKLEFDVKHSMTEHFDRVGLTDQRIAQETTRIALDAKKIHGTDDDFIEIPDESARLRALELASNLKGHLSNNATKNLNAQQITINVQLSDTTKVETECQQSISN